MMMMTTMMMTYLPNCVHAVAAFGEGVVAVVAVAVAAAVVAAAVAAGIHS